MSTQNYATTVSELPVAEKAQQSELLKQIKLSIVIVSWNVIRQLKDCLNSIQGNRPDCELEIIVVDNASDDGTAAALKEKFPNVKLIENPRNSGFSAANNLGLKMAKGRYIFLLNPDTLIHPHALERLIAVMDETPAAGACGPALCDVNGQSCISVGYVPTFRSLLYAKTFFRKLGIFRRHYKKVTASERNYDIRTPVEQISGAAIMVRRSVFDRIGLMDENFFLYFEDVDLCLRIRNAGYDIMYVPEVVVTHVGGCSTEKISTIKQMYFYRSLFLYLRKHKGRFKTTLFALVFKPAVLIRHIINFFEGLVCFVVFTLLPNRDRRCLAMARIKGAAKFFAGCSWQLLFKS